MEHSAAITAYKLPPLIVSQTDVSRVRRELEALDAYLDGQRLREPGQPVARLPKSSRLLDDLAALNNLNLLHATVRRDAQVFLRDLHDHAPVVRISFAAEPSASALQKVVNWLRQNISPAVLVNVGLQPNIVAGCVLRTTNRYFDMSLRTSINQRKQLLIDAISGQPVHQVAPIAATAPEAVHG